ncbi:universal stress protein [Halodesulfurarchaeum formicicum]|nr:universal stress protein [Halodesulfurarchaeum formicicum]
MYQILMPVDRDEDRSAAQAEYILNCPVDHDEIEVTVLHVLARKDASTADSENFDGNEAAIAAANRLEGAGITVNRTLGTGEPVSGRILDRAAEIDADEIVMSGRKRSGVSQVLIGSTATDVMQAAERPVVMVG